MPHGRRFIALSLFTATALLGWSPSAGATATQIGSHCLTASATPNAIVQVASEPGGSTYVAPVRGVVTSWGSVLPTIATALPARVKVFRKVGAQYLVVAESAFEDLVSGENVFSSRVPVEAGDVLGLYGSSSAPYCAADGLGDTLGAILTAGDLPVGTTHPVGGTGNYKAALFATIEPDSDGDGFIDGEDLCPESAASKTPCPTLSLSARATASSRSISVLVSTTANAPATASASATIPKVRGVTKRSTVQFSAVSKNVTAGEIAEFKLSIPSKLKKALGKLPKKTKIKTTITVSGTGLLNTDTETISLTLRGRR